MQPERKQMKKKDLFKINRVLDAIDSFTTNISNSAVLGGGSVRDGGRCLRSRATSAR
jgi:hypothetical protein